MRTISSVALSLFACVAAFGASRSTAAIYVDGNITGVSPNTAGTLMLTDGTSMYLKTGTATVPVPYTGISKTGLGVTKAHSHMVPMYKVWSLQKRFSETTQTQLLTVEFKNAGGEDKTMTLELARPAAKSVLSTIQTRTAAPTQAKAASNEWWGDEYWKTTRNAGKWNRPDGASAEQQ
jgi:hypothetical protein